MKLNSKTNPIPAWKIWTLFFLYSLLVSLAVQLILLPYVFPAWNAGDGMLVGHDSYKFHKIAKEAADLINEHGWSAWRLHPSGQFVAGIASIFYVLITPKPWTVLPLISALHALAGLILYDMVRILSHNWKVGLAAALPFVFFPSALMWVAQMHNESYMVPAQLLFFYGWFLLARPDSYSSPKTIATAVGSIVIGALVTWAIREFLIQVLELITFVATGVLTAVLVSWVIQAKLSWIRAVLAGVLIWGLCFSMGLLPEKSQDRIESSERASKRLDFDWNPSPWLPKYLDQSIRAFSIERQVYILRWSNADSNIDTDVQFHSTMDIIMYLPRALQIGLFAPFPNMWFGSVSQDPNTLMRQESGVEMSLAYLFLLGLPVAIWKLRKNLRMWIVLMYAVGVLLIYTMVTANVGSLYRFRYVYWMTIIAFSIYGWYAAIAAFSALRRRRERLPESNKL